MRCGKILAGSLVAVAGPAWAGESLINGAQLQYNYAYHCNGERVIVDRCRDNDDQSYCQVVYPDRPEKNGMQIAPVEQRGAIVAKLDACARPKAASVAANDSQPVHPSAKVSVGAPGVAKASWSVLDIERDHIEMFTKARLRRSGNIGSGWFTTVYPRPKDYPNDNLSDVEFEQYYMEADCSKGTIRLLGLAFFNDDGKQIFSYGKATDWERTDAGSLGERKFRILCGKPQALDAKTPLVGDGTFIALYTAAMLDRGQ